uniref:Amidohydrolase 3 domain-containing protein n=1 Tax=Globisporangium ultimum (strain ATCC 200006 / CBS 805.95 / DAOM BR144) TaxID=431595 RepID=K3XA87_GLOUD
MTKLFVNGKIWQWKEPSDATAPRHAFAEWMLVSEDDGKIVQIGSGPPPATSPDTHTEDLQGALVLPGLHDSHIHAYYMGESDEFLNLTGCTSFEDFAGRLRKYDAAYPEKAWVVGFGWEQDQLSSSARYPSRYDIDAVIKDRPVVLHRACWHIAAVNTKALEICGIDVTQKVHHIESGTIDVDERGVTGILRENAVELVTKHTWEHSEGSTIVQLLLSYVIAIFLEGLTADACKCDLGIHTNDHKAWQLYEKIQEQSGLPLRVYMTPSIGELKDPATPRPGSKVGILSCDRIKLFSDGSLGAETAAVRQPYIGTDNRGILMDSDADLIKKVSDANADGYRLEIHAIGDRAAEQVLMALKAAQIPAEKRPILTHCQILGEDLLVQMRDQGVIGNIQPSFTITDATFARKRLAEVVLTHSYCWKKMLNSGIVCAGGSDAPIETCNPFQGIYDAIYRHKPGQPQDVFLPDEKLTLEEALEIYTKNGAFAAMEETCLGQLAPGYLADFVVLQQDVTQDHAALLAPDLVQSVWINGKKTYALDASAPQRKADPAYDFSQSSLPGKNGPHVRICRCCCR